jgi:DNA helicase-2/ATP-dependent DNA helicase PcrA
VAAADLTASQHAAVEHYEGPLLVLAGPGSGKTRVITRRIARLVERGVSPREILAITFTNKAAREMAERVERLLPGSRVWVTTFHKFCARLLRERGEAIGLKPNFSIFDTADQQQLIKQVLHEENLDATHFPPAKVGWQISQAKNDLITPERFRARFEERVGDHLQAVVARVYPKYQQRLLDANAVDFDDLLVHVALLLEEHEDLRSQLDQRFRYILVDEYQDTNRAQYQIVASLSQQQPNLCATGDPDQSIYGWRGAQIENILRFERDFPQVTVIRLEDNFRSTPEILAVADALIAHNQRRKAKRLFTANASGPQVELRLYVDGRQEADAIAAEIVDQVREEGRRWSDFAIFYRVNSLSRSLETALALAKAPYQMAAGVTFYERSEIKDLLGYLRLIENPRDRMAFLRVVNTPARGIGKSSVDKLLRWCDATKTPPLDAARSAANVTGLNKRAQAALREFAVLIDDLARKSTGPVAELLADVLARTGYLHIGPESSEDEVQRRANVEELVSAARQYDEQEGDAGSLSGFLESATLAQDVDALDSDLGAVTLMTLHAAKGLEFPCVYIVGVEQNLIPHERALRQYDQNQLEEERRLLFVGLTRAQQRLVLTHTTRREMHGRSLSTIPSDFLIEMPLTWDDRTLGIINAEVFDVDLADDAPALAPQKPRDSRPWVPSPVRITTGAALAAGSNHTASVPLGFSVGMTVRHPRYGLGTVIEVSPGMSRHRTLTVQFEDDARQETFVAAKCPLQPVGVH